MSGRAQGRANTRSNVSNAERKLVEAPWPDAAEFDLDLPEDDVQASPPAGPDGHHSVQHAYAAADDPQARAHLDAEMQAAARAGLARFIQEVFTDAVTVAQRYANVALMSGLAAGALTPVLSQGDDGVQWLMRNQYQALAQWAAQDAQETEPLAAVDADPVALMAARLDAHIHGRVEETADGILLRNAHPKAGEESTRLLRSLNLSGLLREALQGEAQPKQVLLTTFSQELSRLLERQFANTYVHSYTVQEVATQSFLLLSDEVAQGRAGLSRALSEIRAQLGQLSARPQQVIVGSIQSEGGLVNLGSIQTSGGAVVGRDQQVGFNCP